MRVHAPDSLGYASPNPHFTSMPELPFWLQALLEPRCLLRPPLPALSPHRCCLEPLSFSTSYLNKSLMLLVRIVDASPPASKDAFSSPCPSPPSPTHHCPALPCPGLPSPEQPNSKQPTPVQLHHNCTNILDITWGGFCCDSTLLYLLLYHGFSS